MSSVLNDARLPGASIEPRPVQGVSATQIETFLLCPRKWWFGWPAGIKAPQTESMKFGEELHAELEDYFCFRKDAKDLSKLAALGLPHLPERGPGLSVERPLTVDGQDFWTEEKEPLGEPVLRLAGVPVVGYVDLLDPRRMPDRLHVLDHKTTRSFQWCADPDELARKPQLVVYSAAAVKLFGEPKSGVVDLRHVYYRTRGGAAVAPVSTELELDKLPGLLYSIERSVVNMVACSTKQTAAEVEANPKACDAFGGCPHRAYCPAVNALSAKETLMGMFAKLQEKKAEGAPVVGAVGVVPPDAPAPTPPAPLEAKAEEKPAPVVEVKAEPKTEAKPKAAKKAEEAKPSDAAPKGFDLLIDALPIAAQPVKVFLLEELIAKEGAIIAEACNVPHVSLVEYGKGKGYLVAAFDKLARAGAFEGCTILAKSGELSSPILEALIPRARMIIRGIR